VQLVGPFTQIIPSYTDSCRRMELFAFV